MNIDPHLLSPDKRVAIASQEACELAPDALHDTALQQALSRRLDRELRAIDSLARQDIAMAKQKTAM